MAVPAAPILSKYYSDQGPSYSGEGYVYLAWYPNGSDLIDFNIYRGTSIGSPVGSGFILLDTVSATPTAPGTIPPYNAYVDTAVTDDYTPYFYQISSTNADGESALSNVVPYIAGGGSYGLYAYPYIDLTAPFTINAGSLLHSDEGSVGIILYDDDVDIYGSFDDFYVATPGDYGEPSGFDMSIYVEGEDFVPPDDPATLPGRYAYYHDGAWHLQLDQS